MIVARDVVEPVVAASQQGLLLSLLNILIDVEAIPFVGDNVEQARLDIRVPVADGTMR